MFAVVVVVVVVGRGGWQWKRIFLHQTFDIGTVKCKDQFAEPLFPAALHGWQPTLPVNGGRKSKYLEN